MSKYDLLPCPFCGSDVYLNKVPLWKGSHGYHGCYEFDIHCENIDCQCRIYLGQNDTIYRDEKTARENAIKQWNRRVANI